MAALFQPVRRWATRLADRLVFGRRAEPYEVLSRFSDRVAGTYAAEDVLPRARVISEGIGAERVELWLGAGEGLHASASWPGDAEPLVDSDRFVPIRHQDRALGEIRIRKPAAGVGFQLADAGGGTGLQGMADRLDAIRGSLEIRSNPGEGMTILDRVPVN